MDNFLPNGAVLPFGLMDTEANNLMGGFNKTYRNVALRVGVVIDEFLVTDPQNHSKLTTEYNVLVIEQHEDQGATSIVYRNCMSAEGLGSIADFFERTLRKMEKKTTQGFGINLKGQNGAVVLLLCLDSMSDKAIIVGALTHPDRPTNLTNEGPYLEGEFNGVNILVNVDGSATFTFKGATDNNGNVIDSTQGNTVVSIAKDGSYQIQHSTITQTLARSGDASLTASGAISNTTQKDFSVTATGGINLNAQKDLAATMNNLTITAQGTAMLSVNQLSIQSQSQISFNGSQVQVEAQAMAMIKAPQITLDGLTFLGGSGGQPLLLISAQMLGIGNLGAPVISTAISGFTTRTFAT